MTQETEDMLADEIAAVRGTLEITLERLNDIIGIMDRERSRAWWHRGVSLLLVILMVGLGWVAWEQHRSRAENCAAVADAFDVYTEALAGFSSAGADRTDTEQDRFDARVDVFRAEVATRLASCS